MDAITASRGQGRPATGGTEEAGRVLPWSFRIGSTARLTGRCIGPASRTLKNKPLCFHPPSLVLCSSSHRELTHWGSVIWVIKYFSIVSYG